MLSLLLLLLLLLLLSALFSGAEIGFTALNGLLPDMWHKRERLGSGSTRHYFRNPEPFLITCLVGTNISNTAFSSLLAVSLVAAGWSQEGVLALGTLVIFLFGELLPKALFHQLRYRLFPWMSLLIRPFHLALWPLVRFLRFLTPRSGEGERETGAMELRAHMHTLFFPSPEEEQEDTGREIARRVFELRETTLEEVMTPRTEIVAIEEQAGAEELAAIVVRHGFTKVLVYRETLDHIIGYVMAHDLFRAPESIAALVRAVPAVPGSRSAKSQLAAFGSGKCQLAVVLDEFGGTAGLVTLEDLMEELLGDIDDEHDSVRTAPVRLADGRILLDASTPLDEVCELLERPEPESDWETIGGWLINGLGRIPERGETLEIEDLEFRVLSAQANRLGNLMLRETGERDGAGSS